jgi:hypothetical protein
MTDGFGLWSFGQAQSQEPKAKAEGYPTFPRICLAIVCSCRFDVPS